MRKDPDLLWISRALRLNLILFLVGSFAADLWLAPITYILVGYAIVLRRYVEKEQRFFVPAAS